MIRYALRCGADHGFEGWFRSSAAFEEQLEAGHVSCPSCGTTEVEKSLMAPALGRSSRAGHGEDAPAGPADETGKAEVSGKAETGRTAAEHMMSTDPKARALIEAIRQLRRHVVENADYVGSRFAEEARKIHYEEAERRDIYGEATREETEALVEEGIEIAALPLLPDDKN